MFDQGNAAAKAGSFQHPAIQAESWTSRRGRNASIKQSSRASNAWASARKSVTGQRAIAFGIARDNGVYNHGFMKAISLKLPDRLLERLAAESRARGTTKSSLVRECLEKSLGARALGGKASCYDLASDLAGSLKGRPRDLATNPKYLQGFGR